MAPALYAIMIYIQTPQDHTKQTKYKILQFIYCVACLYVYLPPAFSRSVTLIAISKKLEFIYFVHKIIHSRIPTYTHPTAKHHSHCAPVEHEHIRHIHPLGRWFLHLFLSFFGSECITVGCQWDDIRSKTAGEGSQHGPHRAIERKCNSKENNSSGKRDAIYDFDKKRLVVTASVLLP
jgi:hypothetical protein